MCRSATRGRCSTEPCALLGLGAYSRGLVRMLTRMNRAVFSPQTRGKIDWTVLANHPFNLRQQDLTDALPA